MKLKINTNSENINVNNGVFQGSLISPMLFDLYIIDLINDIDNNLFKVLTYGDNFCVLCDCKNQLINALKIIDKCCIKYLPPLPPLPPTPGGYPPPVPPNSYQKYKNF